MKKTLTLIMLLTAAMSATAQEKKIKVVSTDYWRKGLTFVQALGPNRYEIDSLVIKGEYDMLKDEVFGTLRDCCTRGRLTGIDMSKCINVENDEIPAMAFFPELVNGKPRREAGDDDGRGYRTNLRYITLPNTIKRIGESAFALTNLEAVDIPVRASISDGAFSDCKYLKCVTLRGKTVRPASEGYAFSGLAAGAVLQVAPGNGAGYTGVESWAAFGKVDETENAYRVMNVDTDGSRPLADILGSCNMRVDSMRLTGTPAKKDFECLQDNNNFGCLLGLDLSDCFIENGYLYACRFESLRMPRRMTKICNVFLQYSQVEHLTLPESYDEIGAEAFTSYKWFADSTIAIAEGCRKIGYMAFVNCHSLKTVVLPSTLEELEPAALGFTWMQDWLEPEVDLYVNRMTPPYCSDTYNGKDVDQDGPFACDRDHKGKGWCLTRKWRLFVPVGAKKNYENAVHWDHFATIIETPLLTGTSTGISGATADTQPTAVKEVYTADGRLACKGTALPQLPKGLYIIRENGQAHKVIMGK